MRKFLFPRIHGPDHDLCIRSISIYILTKHVLGTWDWSKGARLRLCPPKNWSMRGVICTGILFCSLMIGVGLELVYMDVQQWSILFFGGTYLRYLSHSFVVVFILW